MSDGQQPGIHSILSHQQPPRKALLNIVQPLTRGCLCTLHTPNCYIAAQYRLKVCSRFQSVLQSSSLYPKPIPSDLYHRPQRAPAKANSLGCPRKALIAKYAGFGGLSIFHYDYKRNQTSVREIRTFQLSTRLVKDDMVGQADLFEISTPRA